MQNETNRPKLNHSESRNAAIRLVQANGVIGAIRYCYSEQLLGLLPIITEIAAGRKPN